MKTFEYLFKTIEEKHGDDATVTLTLEGWELLTSNIVTSSISENGVPKPTTYYRCIFKREKKGNN